ncbi:MAG: hypothetical protein ACOX5R_16230 [bacterium]
MTEPRPRWIQYTIWLLPCVTWLCLIAIFNMPVYLNILPAAVSTVKAQQDVTPASTGLMKQSVVLLDVTYPVPTAAAQQQK